MALNFLHGQEELAMLYDLNPLHCVVCGVEAHRLYVYNLWMGFCEACFTFYLQCKKDTTLEYSEKQLNHFLSPTK